MSAFDTLIHIVYLLAAASFVLGLHLMTSPATARHGNLLSAAGMAIAVVSTIAVLTHDHVITALATIVLTVGVLSGGLAGLLTARLAARSKSPLAVFLSGASMALFTGAIGGGCVGLHGIVGMGLGIAVGIVPMMLFRRPRHE